MGGPPATATGASPAKRRLTAVYSLPNHCPQQKNMDLASGITSHLGGTGCRRNMRTRNSTCPAQIDCGFLNTNQNTTHSLPPASAAISGAPAGAGMGGPSIGPTTGASPAKIDCGLLSTTKQQHNPCLQHQQPSHGHRQAQEWADHQQDPRREHHLPSRAVAFSHQPNNVHKPSGRRNKRTRSSWLSWRAAWHTKNTRHVNPKTTTLILTIACLEQSRPSLLQVLFLESKRPVVSAHLHTAAF